MTKKTYRSVEAGGKVHVTLKAIFFDKGVYDLNRSVKCLCNHDMLYLDLSNCFFILWFGYAWPGTRFKCIILPPANTITIPSVVQTFSNQSIIHIRTMAGDGASGGSIVSPITENVVTSIMMSEVVTSTEEELPQEMGVRRYINKSLSVDGFPLMHLLCFPSAHSLM